MTKTTVDLGMLSKKREDIFDYYHNVIEKVRLDFPRQKTKVKSPDFEIIV